MAPMRHGKRPTSVVACLAPLALQVLDLHDDVDKTHAGGCISLCICLYTLQRTENGIYAIKHSRNVNGALTLYLAWPSVCWTAVEKLGRRQRRSRVTAS